MELTDIITDASSILGQVPTTFTSLSTAFGAVLMLPVTLVLSRTVIRMVKSLLMFRGGRRR